jgi:hypothetical protein
MHLAVAAVIGAAIIAVSQAYQPALLEWVRSDPALMRGRAQMLIAAAAAILLAPLLGFAIYIWRLGSRIIREQRFPPVGLAVVRDVRVVHGADAHARGRLLRMFALALCVMTALIALLVYRLATLTPNP